MSISKASPTTFARKMEYGRVFLDHRFERPATDMAGLRDFIRATSRTIDRDDDRFWRHQNEATAQVVDHLCDPDCDPQTICVIPTGGGKTEIFLRLVNAFRTRGRSSTVIPNTMILVPTIPLISQTLQRIAASCPGLPVGHLASDEAITVDGRPIAPRVRPVTLMTYQGFVGAVRDGRIAAEDVDMLILDEAHRALSDLRREVFGTFMGNTVISAFSATPAFDRERNLHALLGQDNEVVRISAKRLRDDGIIAPAINYVFGIKLEGALPADSRARATALKTLSVSSILDFYEKHVEPSTGTALFGKTALCYTRDIEHARMAAREFNRRYCGRGLRMEMLTGNDTQARINQVLDDLRRGDTTAVVSARLLEEGIDVPEVGVILNFASTESAVREVQRCGRGMRLDRSLPPEVDQTTFVVDGYHELNGMFMNRPRFYFETVDDPSMARFVARKPPRPYFDPKDRFGAETGLDEKGDYSVSSGVDHIAYLLRGRDDLPTKTDEWLSRDNIKFALRKWRAEIDKLWTSMEESFRSTGAVIHAGDSIRVGLFRPEEGRPVFCVHASEIEAVSELLRIQIARSRRAREAKRGRQAAPASPGMGM